MNHQTSSTSDNGGSSAAELLTQTSSKSGSTKSNVDQLRLLILGSGAVGERLLQMCSNAIGTTTSATKLQSNERLILLDALDADAMKKVIEEQRPDVVVMAIAPRQRLQPEPYRQFFVSIANNVVDSLRGTEHLMYLGSSALYGDHQGKLVTESSELLARLNRGSTQRLAQEKALTYSRTTVFRLGMLFGSNFSALSLQKVTGSYAGVSSRMINFTHTDDAARAIIFAAERGDEMLGAYNIAGLSRQASDVMPLVSTWTGEVTELTESNFVLSTQLIEERGFTFQHRQLS